MHPNPFQRRDFLTIATLLGLLCVMLAGGAPALPIPGPQESEGEEEKPTPFMVTCEVSCSQENVGTGQARLTWTAIPGVSPALARLDAPESRLRLETTVYREGFEKELYQSMSLSDEAETGPDVEQAIPPEELPRAFQVRVMEVQRAMALADFETPATPGTSAVVEGLEPGMNYTWRVVVETGADRFVSETVTCRAPICPADPVGREQR